MLHESLSFYLAPHLDRPLALGNLTSVLEARFRESGVQSDLSEATLLRQEALAISTVLDFFSLCSNLDTYEHQ
jgi:hypothetical protein